MSPAHVSPVLTASPSSSQIGKVCAYSERTVLELVGLIYDAAGNPTRWPLFLERLGQVLDSTANNLWLQDLRSQEFNLTAELGVEPSYQRSYADYFRTQNIYLVQGGHLLRTGSVYPSQALCPDEVALQSEFYNDWIAPQKHRHGMLGVIFKKQSLVGMVGAIRPKNGNPFRDQELSLFRTLMPHLQRAVQLHLRIAELETKQEAASYALNCWSLGVIFLNHEGRVILMNRSAEGVIRRKDGLYADRDGLHAAHPAESIELRRLISGAIQASLGRASVPGGPMPLSRQSLRRALNVLVTPAPRMPASLSVAGAAAIVFLSDPDAEETTDDESLRVLYGLSPAEAQLAALLAEGKDLKRIGEELGITLNTARTHLKRVFDKTGTKRQAELVRLLLRSPVFQRLKT